MFCWMSLDMFDLPILDRVWNYAKMELWVLCINECINLCFWHWSVKFSISLKYIHVHMCTYFYIILGPVSCGCWHTRLYITRNSSGRAAYCLNQGLRMAAIIWQHFLDGDNSICHKSIFTFLTNAVIPWVYSIMGQDVNIRSPQIKIIEQSVEMLGHD